MTVTEKIEMYKGKAAFVKEISKAFQTAVVKTGVLAVDYEVYCKEVNPDTVHFVEYIVVTFVGGGQSVRCANGNSNNANFREIAKLIDGGYYDEIRDYEALQSRGFVKVDL